MKNYTQRSLRQYRSSSVGFHEEEISNPLKHKLFIWLYHPRFDIVMLCCVLISIIILIAELSNPDENHSGSWIGSVMGKETNPLLLQLDILFTVIFAIEYLIKFWIHPYKWSYFRSNIIELFALFPILRVFRMMRILRIVRLIRLIRINRIIEQNISFEDDQTTDMVTVLMYLFFSIVFGTIGIIIFERGNNEAFAHISDGLWWCIVTITTVGYGDKFPVTLYGKIVASCIMFIGLAFYASLTGVISQTLINKAREKKKKRMEENMFAQHIIICGWNTHAPSISEQILKDEEQLILAISPSEVQNFSHPRLMAKIQDPTHRESLQEAKIEQAKMLLLLSQENLVQGSDCDGRNLLIAMNARMLNPEITIIMEVQNKQNILHAENVGIDKTFHVSELASNALLNIISTELEQYNPVRTIQIPCPTELYSKSFAQANTYFAKQHKQILLGIIRNNQNIIPCPFDEPLTESDICIVLR